MSCFIAGHSYRDFRAIQPFTTKTVEGVCPSLTAHYSHEDGDYRARARYRPCEAGSGPATPGMPRPIVARVGREPDLWPRHAPS